MEGGGSGVSIGHSARVRWKRTGDWFTAAVLRSDWTGRREEAAEERRRSGSTGSLSAPAL